MNSSRPIVRLLVRPAPDFREGASEYVQRVAKVNGFRGADEIARVFGVPLCHIVTQGVDRLWDVIQGKANADTLRLRSGDLPLTRSGKGTQGVSLSARFCPRCLAESDVLSKDWSLPLSISCEKHKIVLLDRCPHCLERITQSDSLYRCRCGQDFRQADSQPTPHWERHYYELFAPWRALPSLSVGTVDLFHLERLAGRITRRLIRHNPPEKPPETDSLRARPYWWIHTLDHSALETICRDEQTLAEVILGLFPNFFSVSKNPYARHATNIGMALPRILLITRQLATARSIEVRKAREARVAELESIAISLGVPPIVLSRGLGFQAWQRNVRAISGEPYGSDLLHCLRLCVTNTVSVENLAQELGVSIDSLSGLCASRSSQILRVPSRPFERWRIHRALAEELGRTIRSDEPLAKVRAFRTIDP